MLGLNKIRGGQNGHDKLRIEILDEGKRIWVGMHGSSFDIVIQGGEAVANFTSFSLTEKECLNCFEKEIGRGKVKRKIFGRKGHAYYVDLILNRLKIPLKYWGEVRPDYLSDNQTLCGFSGWLPDWDDERIACYGPRWEETQPDQNCFNILFGYKTSSGTTPGGIYWQNDISLNWLLLKREGNLLFARKAPDIIIEGNPLSEHRDGEWMFYQMETGEDEPNIALGGKGNVPLIPLPEKLRQSFPSILAAAKTTRNNYMYKVNQVDSWERARKYFRREFRAIID